MYQLDGDFDKMEKKLKIIWIYLDLLKYGKKKKKNRDFYKS